MKTYWGVEIQLHDFLTWALDGDEWWARLCHFTPGKEPLVPIRKGGTQTRSGHGDEEELNRELQPVILFSNVITHIENQRKIFLRFLWCKTINFHNYMWFINDNDSSTSYLFGILTLRNFDDDFYINMAWEGQMKCKLFRYRKSRLLQIKAESSCDEECSKLWAQTKEAKLQWLQIPS